MTIQNPMVRIAIKYGLAAGAFSIVTFLVLSFLGQRPIVNLNGFIIDIIVLLAFIWMALREFKSYNNGELRFWQGMSIGIIIFLIVAIVFGIFLQLYLTLINPEYLEVYKSNAREILLKTQEKFPETVDEAGIKEKMIEIGNASAWQLALSGFFKKMISGMLIAPVAAIILRK